MAYDKSNERLVGKRDLIHIAILLAIALAIGVYLIATTVLIAKDGVFYIELAQQFSSDPIATITRTEVPPGYPCIILAVHRLIGRFHPDGSIEGWILSAQTGTMACWLMSIFPLYLLGKTLVGSHKSFYGMLILLILPDLTHNACDTLRDWPHLLFLSTGFLLLILGTGRDKWWIFGLAGLVSGIGYLIRVECMQLVVYGEMWLAINLLRPARDTSKPKLVAAMVLLVAGFAVFAVPYMTIKGDVVPVELRRLMNSLVCTGPMNEYHAAIVPIDIIRGVGRLINAACETMLYFFAVPLLIGAYCCLRKKTQNDHQKFLISSFISLNTFLFVWLYCARGHNSARQVFALVVFTIFYVPVGLQVMADWLRDRNVRKGTERQRAKKQHWFFALIIIGSLICMPKLFRPLRDDKRSYRTTSDWLKEHTKLNDVIMVPDPRITFYAERKGRKEISDRIPIKANYAVIIFKDGNEMLPPLRGRQTIEKMYSVDCGKESQIIVYKMGRSQK